MRVLGSVVSVLILAAIISLTIRLYRAGLHRTYRAFFFYLFFFALQSVMPIAFSRTGGTYQLFWLITEPIDWLFYVWVVLELYSLVLKDYQGLYTAGRRSLIVAISVALAASGFSLLVPSRYTEQGHLMAYYYVAERAVCFSLVVFLITIMGLLMWYPITLNRNTTIHSLVFSVYFPINTVIFGLLTTHDAGMPPLAGYAIQLVNLVTLGAWLTLLSAAGEGGQQKLRPDWMPGREEELVARLEKLNLELVGAARKARDARKHKNARKDQDED